MRLHPALRAALWAFLGGALAFLYLPLLPPLVFSIGLGGPATAGQGLTLHWYGELGRNPLLVSSLKITALVAMLVGAITPVLGLLAAMAVRELRIPRLMTMLVLLPLFIPGISLGLACAFLFRLLDVPPSLWTITVVHILWALPYAFLIILTAMAGFDPGYLEAAYVHGAGRLRAFRDVELPLIRPGIGGAATFSMILSFNETARTSLVQGPLNTVQTYIWSTYRQVGLSPTLYALMSLIIAGTLALTAVTLLAGLGSSRRAQRKESALAEEESRLG